MTYYEQLVEAACNADLRSTNEYVNSTADILTVGQAHGACLLAQRKYGKVPERSQRGLAMVGSADPHAWGS